MSTQIEDYVHRVGRTARAGSSGKSYTFFAKGSLMVAPALVDVLQQSELKTEIPPALLQMAEKAKGITDPEMQL